jgi:putative transposase
MKFKFIANNHSSFPVKKMCHILNVSPSRYYRWRKSPLSSRKIQKEQLQERIKILFLQHKGMAGSPMITADLREDPMFSNVSRNRVARYMKRMEEI